MSSKTYEQKVARLVQEATGAAYMTALRWTNEHVATHPDRMTKEERALAITEKQATGTHVNLRATEATMDKYDNTLVCGECKATIHASVNLTENLRAWYRREALQEALEAVRQADVTDPLHRPEAAIRKLLAP